MAWIEVAKSDLISFKEAHEGTQVIVYGNRINYAKLDYSENPAFMVRVESKFFEQRFPETNESEKESNAKINKLSSTTKVQRQLEAEPFPQYMAKKLTLILQHNAIAIDGKYWEKEESIESRLLDRVNPFKTFNVWLTEKEDEFYINVYGTLESATNFNDLFNQNFE